MIPISPGAGRGGSVFRPIGPQAEGRVAGESSDRTRDDGGAIPASSCFVPSFLALVW